MGTGADLGVITEVVAEDLGTSAEMEAEDSVVTEADIMDLLGMGSMGTGAAMEVNELWMDRVDHLQHVSDCKRLR